MPKATISGATRSISGQLETARVSKNLRLKIWPGDNGKESRKRKSDDLKKRKKPAMTELNIKRIKIKRKNSSKTYKVKGGPKYSWEESRWKARKKPKNSAVATSKKIPRKAKNTILGASSLPFRIFPIKESFCLRM